MMQLADVDDLTKGLVYSSKKVSAGTCVKDFLGMLSSADNPTPAGKAGAFISFGNSKVQVEFETISKRLRRQVLESVTREKHGPEGVRILRLLLGAGKMDEKQASFLSVGIHTAGANGCIDFKSSSDGSQRRSTIASGHGR
jgi:DNA-directed RNA polymerase III subunit RPC3